MKIILAVDNQFGYATTSSDKPLAWSIKEDLQNFKKITTSVHSDDGLEVEQSRSKPNVLLMGSKTGVTFSKPLPNRVNYVVSRKPIEKPGFYWSPTIQQALETIKVMQNNGVWGDLYLIGGGELIRSVLANEELKREISHVSLTRINHDFGCDLKLPELKEFIRVEGSLNSSQTELVTEHQSESKVSITYQHFSITNTARNSGEESYLQVMRELLDAPVRIGRNGPVASKFGRTLEFDLADGFPLLTTKRVFWSGIVNELLFFLSGNTNTKWLEDRKVKIWHDNTTREFLDERGLDYPEHFLGPMYSWQFRNFNGTYDPQDPKIHDPSQWVKAEGDQLSKIINTLLNDPMSRRILMTSFNPAQVEKGVLYPCHSLILQFYVDHSGELSLQMYQRSADWFIGIPYNIASQALTLTILVSHLNYRIENEGLKTQLPENRFKLGKVKIVFGDYHLYQAHLEATKEQLSRSPRPFPTLEISEPIKEVTAEYLTNLTPENFKLVGYQPYPSIKAPMIA